MRGLTNRTPALAPDAPAEDDTEEREDARFDCIFANRDHLRRLRGRSFDHEPPRACAAAPWQH